MALSLSLETSAEDIELILFTNVHVLIPVLRLYMYDFPYEKCIFFLCLLSFMLLPGLVSLVKQVLISRLSLIHI